MSPLLDFDLWPVERIAPWGESRKLSLSWFALTDGAFRTIAQGFALPT